MREDARGPGTIVGFSLVLAEADTPLRATRPDYEERTPASSRFEAREFGLEFEAELFGFVVRQPL